MSDDPPAEDGRSGDGDSPPSGNDGRSGTGDDAPDDDSEADLHADLVALHDHLAATEELPVDPAAARWIGEAQAVAADLADDETVSREVVARRVGHVRDLLERMGDPEHEGARERVDAALSVVERVEGRVGARSGGGDRSDSE